MIYYYDQRFWTLSSSTLGRRKMLSQFVRNIFGVDAPAEVDSFDLTREANTFVVVRTRSGNEYVINIEGGKINIHSEEMSKTELVLIGTMDGRNIREGVITRMLPIVFVSSSGNRGNTSEVLKIMRRPASARGPVRTLYHAAK